MPRMNGHEFLEKLRQNRSLRSTPVFILTTSVDPSDVELAYEHYVAGYFEKATRFPGDDSIARYLQMYADMVILPRLSADAGLSA
ncbi:MAG: response regulator, partial [Planctomycetota bacterium]